MGAGGEDGNEKSQASVPSPYAKPIAPDAGGAEPRSGHPDQDRAAASRDVRRRGFAGRARPIPRTPQAARQTEPEVTGGANRNPRSNGPRSLSARSCSRRRAQPARLRDL